jgi:ABC-2 type transport system ATP-binding protein
MAVVEVNHLTYRYGKFAALRDLDLSVPEGALYALLGPNGSGKTTLLQVLMGLRRPTAGRVSLMGVDSLALTLGDRSAIGYIAEGQSLPKWMRLEQLEAYLAPLYPTWDAALARDLRTRFDLDPRKTIGTLSRGQQMKAALLCALAPRPKLLLMDEPFTGMDALVKDDLVRGLLESSGSEGWTVLLCSHDIGELELLADWVGFLDAGTMRLSESMDAVRARFKRVEVVMGDIAAFTNQNVPSDWMSIERAGQRMTFVASHADDAPLENVIRSRFPSATRVDVRDATLREVFVALARRNAPGDSRGVAA